MILFHPTTYPDVSREDVARMGVDRLLPLREAMAEEASELDTMLRAAVGDDNLALGRRLGYTNIGLKWIERRLQALGVVDTAEGLLAAIVALDDAPGDDWDGQMDALIARAKTLLEARA